MEFGLTKDLVDIIVRNYLKKNKQPPISQGIPGKIGGQDLERDGHVSVKEHLSTLAKRANASHPNIINAWFDNVESLFQKIALDPVTSSGQNRI